MSSIAQNQENNKKKPLDKSRYFCFLIYPDSCGENWQEKLETLGQPIAISPLHDKDVSDVDWITGEARFKKPHWHCIYVADNSVTADSVRKKLQRKLGNKAVSQVKICDGVGNYYEYLTHESKDAIAKKKHVYDKKDIIHLNNFDIDRYKDKSKEAKEDLLMYVCMVIKEYKLANVIELVEFVESEENTQLTMRNVMDIVTTNSSALRLFFDGVYQVRRNEILPLIEK